MDGPGRKELTHQRIVETAARAIRRAGFQGVGVADIMKEAGLTHGGFYAHFASRDALLTEALAHAAADSGARLKQRAAAKKDEARGVSPYRALVEAYLSESHLTAPEGGCPVAALLSEMPRQAEEVQRAGASCVDGLFRVVKDSLPSGVSKDEVAVITTQLVGALQLARALGDNARGKSVLAASRRELLARHARPTATGA
jgi:TetR/AcrR family transcriptional regulator, transcriptional repressor for nem operon